MRFFTEMVALAVSLAYASALSERQTNPYPLCTKLCFTDPVVGACSPTDTACLCKNDDYLRTTATCFQMQCIDEDRKTAFAVAQQLCKAAGVDISTNPAAQPTTTATATHNAAATGSVAGKGMMLGGLIAAAGVLAL